MSKVPHPMSICGQWMAHSSTHSKMHALQWVCLQTTTLEEVGLWASGRQLHDMFASMLMFCEVTNPRQLWDAH
jgi:hypothetical protein